MDPLQELRTALRPAFAWYEDDLIITIRCRTCGHDTHYTHHASPHRIAIDTQAHLETHGNMVRYLDGLPDA